MAIEKGVDFPVSASDAFSGTFDKLKLQVKEARGGFDDLKKAAEAAVLGLSAFKFAEMIKGTIEAADKLDNLSRATGIAVEQLAGLKIAALQSGGDLDSIGASINKLAANMGKNADRFKILGVTAKDPIEAFKQLADVFSKVHDPELRAALGAETLGKSWAGAAPLLAQGGAKIQEMIDRGSEFSGVSTEMARQAHELSDKWVLLTQTGGLMTRMVGPLLPLFNSLTDDLLHLTEQSRGAGQSFSPLLEILKVILVVASDVDFVFTSIGMDIARMVENVKLIASGDFAGSRALGAQFAKDAAERRKALDEWQAKIMAIGTASDDAGEHAHKLTNAELAAAAAAAAKAKAFVDAQTASKSAGEELLVTLQKELDKISNTTGVDKTYNQVVEELTKKKYALIGATKEEILDIARRIDLKKKELETDKFLTEEHQKEIDHAKAQGDILEQLSNDWADVTEKMQDEVDLLGQSDLARAKSIVLRKAENDIAKANNDAETIRDINTELAKQLDLLEQKDRIQKSLQIWDELASKGAQFFSDLVQHGRRAFQDLYAELKNFAAELVAIFAKRWILQIAASATGSSALGAAAGQVGQGTVAGAAGNYLGGAANTLLGSYLAGGGAGGFTGAFSAGYTANAAYLAGSAEMAPIYGTAAGEMGGAAASIAEPIMSVLAEIPVYGWIALAVVAIAAYFGSKGGGPKTGGSFMGSFDSSGHMTGPVDVPGSDNGRFYTPDQLDKPMQQLVQGTATGFFQALRGLGGTTGGFHFGLGTDSDPQGDAQSRISGMVTDANGRVIYQVQDRSMDDKEVPAQLQLEAQRMILAALQASDLPKDVANILNKVDVKTATADQITGVIGLATAFENLGQTIAALEGGPLVALKQQLTALDNSVENAHGGLLDAIAGGDPTKILAAEQQLEQAVMARYAAEIQMVEQLREAIRQTEEAAYQFAMNIASRINAVGGSVNIAGMAMDRAGVLQGQINSNEPLQYKIQDINGYVAAIDSWYNSERDRIMAAAQAQADANAANYRAMAAGAKAQADAIQKQIDLAKGFADVLNRASTMIKDMQYSSANPLHALGRLDLARQDTEALVAQYQGSSGQAHVDAANKLLDALQNLDQMGQDSLQRPSNEYSELYNFIMRNLTMVQADAKSESAQMVDLQQQLLDAQNLANSYEAQAASAGVVSSHILDGLNEEAKGYYTWAQEQGSQLYAMQRQSYMDQLNAITGGVDVDLFIASKQAEAVSVLKEIRSLIAAWASPPGGSTTAPPAGTPGGSSTTPGGSSTTSALARPKAAAISTGDFLTTAKAAAPQLKRILVKA